MPRPRNVIPSSRTNLSIPEDLRAKLDLALWSEAEGRVPVGAYQTFFVSMLRMVLDGAVMETPCGRVRGSRDAIEYLKRNAK